MPNTRLLATTLLLTLFVPSCLAEELWEVTVSEHHGYIYVDAPEATVYFDDEDCAPAAIHGWNVVYTAGGYENYQPVDFLRERNELRLDTHVANVEYGMEAHAVILEIHPGWCFKGWPVDPPTYGMVLWCNENVGPCIEFGFLPFGQPFSLGIDGTELRPYVVPRDPYGGEA